MGIAELLGWSIGMLSNPWILIAGFVVAKKSPRKTEFWLRLAAACGICVAVQIGFDIITDDGLTSRWSLTAMIMMISLSTFWATLFFLIVRQSVQFCTRHKNMAEM